LNKENLLINRIQITIQFESENTKFNYYNHKNGLLARQCSEIVSRKRNSSRCLRKK